METLDSVMPWEEDRVAVRTTEYAPQLKVSQSNIILKVCAFELEEVRLVFSNAAAMLRLGYIRACSQDRTESITTYIPLIGVLPVHVIAIRVTSP